ncbi:MAG: MYXO-CTERM sorting domain-containing protein [Polyangiaceae bacterium]
MRTVLFVFLLLCSIATPANAYTVQTQVTPGCHERITADALRIVRKALATAKPLPLTGDDAPLSDDLPFDLPDDLHDLGGVTILIGVRDNDLKGLPATSLDELVQLTATSSGQREHCLRAAEDVEPNGTKNAIDDCRQYILETLTSALDGLDATGTPDPNLREGLDVTLAIRGQIHVQLPIFYVRVARAMHAIEDSYAHDWRSAKDPHQITCTLNWTAFSENRIDEAVTGPAHSQEMDRCDDPDALRAERRGLATEGAAAALMAALDPTLTRDGKIQAFQSVIDTYVSYDSADGCNFSNHWCNAAEQQYAPSSCSCRVVGGRESNASEVAFAFAAVGLILVVRRRRRGFSKVAATLAIGLAFLIAPTNARADDSDAGTPPPATPGGEAVPSSPPRVAVRPKPETSSGTGPLQALTGNSASGSKGVEDKAGAFFAAAAIAGSFDRPALMARIGGRYALSRYWMVGLDVEWNPFLAVGESHFRAGSGAVYGSLIRRFQLAYEPINLRTTVSAGASMLLFDLVGAPTGSIGPYFGVSLLGLEVKLGKGFYLTIDPTSIAIPVPHVTGIPFVYYQYRFMLGLELGG